MSDIKKYSIKIDINTSNLTGHSNGRESSEWHFGDTFEEVYTYVKDDFDKFQSFLETETEVTIPIFRIIKDNDLETDTSVSSTEVIYSERNISSYISSYLDRNKIFTHSFENFSFYNYKNSISGSLSGIIYNSDELEDYMEYSGLISGGFGFFADSGGFTGDISYKKIDRQNELMSGSISGFYLGSIVSGNPIQSRIISGFLNGDFEGKIQKKQDIKVIKTITIRKSEEK